MSKCRYVIYYQASGDNGYYDNILGDFESIEDAKQKIIDIMIHASEAEMAKELKLSLGPGHISSGAIDFQILRVILDVDDIHEDAIIQQAVRTKLEAIRKELEAEKKANEENRLSLVPMGTKDHRRKLYEKLKEEFECENEDS